MKNKKTVPYKFNIDEKSPRFKAAYQQELARLYLAHRLAELREKRGLSQGELAKKVGTTQAGISRLENPNYLNYSLSTLGKIATALGARLKVDLVETANSEVR